MSVNEMLYGLHVRRKVQSAVVAIDYRIQDAAPSVLFVRGLENAVQPHFPLPVGFEGVGIVDALGPQVDGPVPEQRVVVINLNGGDWAEYAVVPVRDALPVPDDLPDEQVASFSIHECITM
jgi:NADPH:quinone reductase-like Zn-dependent oxidoreductase